MTLSPGSTSRNAPHKGRGVAFHLGGGLVVIMALTVMAGLIAGVAMSRLYDEMQRMASERLPSLVAIANLARQSETVASAVPNLALAQNEFVLRTEERRIRDQLAWLEDLARDAGRSGLDPSLLAEISLAEQSLLDTVAMVRKSVDERIAAQKRGEQAHRRLLDLNTALAAVGPKLPAATMDEPPERAWLREARQTHTLMLAALGAIKQAAVAPLKAQAEAAMRRAAAALGRTTGEAADLIIPLHDGISALTLGPDDVFSLRVDQITLDLAAQSSLLRNKAIADHFAASLSGAFEDIRRQVEADMEATRRTTAFSAGVVTVSSAVLVAICVAIFLYVGRRVIRRLKGLHDSMVAHATGEAVAIDTSGDDEIADMAQALDYFVATLSRREQALRESNERFDLAVRATRSAIWDHDLATGQHWWSPEFFAFFGYQPGELPSDPETLDGLVHRDDVSAMVDAERRHLADSSSDYHVVYRARHRNGSWVWIESRGRALRDGSGGAVTRFIGIASNITEVKEREQRETRLARAFDVAPAAMHVLDPEDRLILWNDRYRALHPDIVGPEALGMALEALLWRMHASAPGLPGWEQVLPRITERLARHHRYTGPFEEHVDRSGRWFLTSEHRMADGSTVVMHVDITERKEAEVAIRTAGDEAKRALADLRSAQASLIQAEKLASLGGLVAGVAHEINTPVGIVVTAASHLVDQTQDFRLRAETERLRKADLVDFLGTVEEANRIVLMNGQRAAHLVQSFKLVAVDQTNDEEMRLFDLAAYVSDVLVALRPRLDRAGHRIEIDIPPGLEFDSYPGPFSQVLTNLVMNALIHAFGDGRAGTIIIKAAAMRPGWVELVFADDGRGIPAETLPRVFDPFFTTNRHGGGTGLGLHIVYNLVTHALGGTLQVCSEPGSGTAFHLHLPQSLPMGHHPSARAREPAS
ncbi:MAG TPA: ATP-binding protein [Azospirillaceae bacterium]|nr:ATP-binding protein [Azospirillaceae bacterium]